LSCWAALETRLRLAQAWSWQLEALEASLIQQPVFITGMWRSGSTFLHELLAEDPENRIPGVWEVMFPVPGRNEVRSEVDPWLRKAEACLWWFRRLAPGADSVYPTRAWTPHECVAIHDADLAVLFLPEAARSDWTRLEMDFGDRPRDFRIADAPGRRATARLRGAGIAPR
jgi:hypothetical protein